MDPVLGWLLIGLIISLMLLLSSGVTVYYLYQPSARMRRAILRQARQDYQHARGFAHLNLLRQGRTNLSARISSLVQAETDCQQTLKTLSGRESDQLRLTLEHYIILHHLDIHGIGQKLRSDLLHIALQGRMNDLKYARQRIYGIGESRQAAIDSWVRRWEERIPGMLQEDFPGKSEIIREYANQRKNAQDRLVRLANEKEPLEKLLSQANAEIVRLEKVKPKHFQQTLLTPELDSGDVDHFVQGVFAEWEPVPAWFKEVLALGNL